MGADALLIVRCTRIRPSAWSDGAQQLSLELFAKLMCTNSSRLMRPYRRPRVTKKLRTRGVSDA